MPKYQAIGRTMQVTPSAISNAAIGRLDLNPKALRQLDSRLRTIKCTSATMPPYKQSDTAKFTAWLCISTGTSLRLAESMFERTPTTSSRDSRAITARKSINFQGLSDSMNSRYTSPAKVRWKKLGTLGCPLSVVRGASQFLATHREAQPLGARSVPLRSGSPATITLGRLHGAPAGIAAAA